MKIKTDAEMKFNFSNNHNQPNESYINDNGKKCVCGSEGFVCLCDDTATFCPAGSSKWTDQLTCKAKCIKGKGF